MVLRNMVRKLAELDTCGLPVTSFYLDTDRRNYTPLQSVEMAHQLVRHVRMNLMSALISDSARQSVDRDLAHITRLIGAESQEQDVRGLVVFSCSGAKVWEVLRLPIALSSTVKVGRHAAIRPLARIADDLAPYVVVLADRRQARFFVVELGGITELQPVADDVPGRVHPGSHCGLNDSAIERHVDEQIHHHLKRVACELSSMMEWQDITRVVIGGTPDVVPYLLSLLTPSVSSRVAGLMDGLTILSPQDDVLRKSLDVISLAEQRKEYAVVNQIVDTNRAGGLGVLGVASTLKAIYARAVRLLAVDVDLSLGGWRCLACKRLYTGYGPCPECGEDAVWFDDLVEESIRQAVCQDAEVEVVSDQRSRIRLQGIAGLLHYPVPSAKEPRPKAIA